MGHESRARIKIIYLDPKREKEEIHKAIEETIQQHAWICYKLNPETRKLDCI